MLSDIAAFSKVQWGYRYIEDRCIGVPLYAVEFAAIIFDIPSPITISVSLAVKDEFCLR